MARRPRLTALPVLLLMLLPPRPSVSATGRLRDAITSTPDEPAAARPRPPLGDGAHCNKTITFAYRARNITVYYAADLDGAGSTMADGFVHFIAAYVGQKRQFDRMFEWCAGPSFVGFALLAQARGRARARVCLCECLSSRRVRGQAGRRMRGWSVSWIGWWERMDCGMMMTDRWL